jgi:hypothetical protein
VRRRRNARPTPPPPPGYDPEEWEDMTDLERDQALADLAQELVAEHRALHPLGDRFQVAGGYEVSFIGAHGPDMTVFQVHARAGSFHRKLKRVKGVRNRDNKRDKRLYPGLGSLHMSVESSTGTPLELIAQAFGRDKLIEKLFLARLLPGEEPALWIESWYDPGDLLTLLGMVAAVEKIGAAYGLRVVDWF